MKNQPGMIKKLTWDSIVLYIGVFFSLILVIALPKVYFHIDLEIFWKWSHYWIENWKNIYVSCMDCNYPILGMFSSAGVLGFLGNQGFEKAVVSYRLFLGLIDGLTVLLLFGLLKMFQVGRPALWAGILGISVSSWSGTVWGQIDGISQLLILLTLTWMVGANLKNQSLLKNFRIYIVVSAILLACLLLIKQLTLFSVFSLGLLLAANIGFQSRSWKQFALNSSLAFAVFLGIILFSDLFLRLPAPYFSHLQYIWEIGSNHGDFISGNGFNIWMFLGRNMFSASSLPLAGLNPIFSPYRIGNALFALYVAVITLSLFFFLKRHFLTGQRFLTPEALLSFIFYLALVNLSFNIFLTGTHERYLMHFYPFIIVAWLGLKSYSPHFSNEIFALILFGANLYGFFILQILFQSLGIFPHEFIPYWIIGLFHIALLAGLTVVFMRYQEFSKNIATLLKQNSLLRRIFVNSKLEKMSVSLKNKITPTLLLFIAIFVLGIFARTWEFGTLPPGLNTDEASIGLEAYNLYHFGVDRNGMSFPVHLISWGSGQNVLYAYLLIPLIAFKGLNAFTIRLPMLICGIVSLPLVYYVGLRIFDRKLALISMFLLAISPWHIILSRWGLESNLLPFVFLAGFVFLLKSTQDNRWFFLACAFFGLCFYAYGPAYLGVPVFLVCAIPVLIYFKQIGVKSLAIGLAILALIAAPVLLFLAVNSFHLSTITVGMITAPRLPAQPRYELLAAVFGSNPLGRFAANAWDMVKLLTIQSDGLGWNVLEPYGYLYAVTFPLAILGVILLLPTRKTTLRVEKLLLLAWIIASLSIGIMQPVNLNRINLIFIPLIISVGLLLVNLDQYYKRMSLVAASLFFVGFFLFTSDYHSDTFKKTANGLFYEGVIPALASVQQTGDTPICLTDTLFRPYIYVMFVERKNPVEYVKTIQWIDPTDPFRDTHQLGRYSFGLNYCQYDPKTIYVLSLKEKPPDNGTKYKSELFTKYRVYTPKGN